MRAKASKNRPALPWTRECLAVDLDEADHERYSLFLPTHVWRVIDGTSCAAQAQAASVVGRVRRHQRTA